jgi:hypothetical protein
MRCAVCAASAELAGGAEEYETLVRREYRLVVLAVGIDPEFEHPARAMERARHAPVARELANIAQVDENDIVSAVQRNRRGGGERLDLALGGRHQLVDMGRDVLRHRERRMANGE